MRHSGQDFSSYSHKEIPYKQTMTKQESLVLGKRDGWDDILPENDIIICAIVCQRPHILILILISILIPISIPDQ